MSINTKVVNLFGGPGSGKSTTAAGIFHKLKKQGYKCELVTEWVKDWAWQNKKLDWYDQLNILSGQITKEAQLYGKVEYIITDSPILLSSFYEQIHKAPSLTGAATKDFLAEVGTRQVKHINIYLPSDSYANYKTEGRYQNAKDAQDIHNKLLKFLNENLDTRIHIAPNLDIDQIVNYIINKEPYGG